ncbi:L,D-transpeptidase [Bacillus velezensis]
MRFFLLSAVLLLSPLWPLGANPLPGDPYIIVNKATNALAVVKDNRIEGIYQVATGKTDDLTPEGEFTVTVKAVNPYYRKKNVEGGAPENPLGVRWIGFDAKGTDGRIYGIHGTNREELIGGVCIKRLHPYEKPGCHPYFPDYPSRNESIDYKRKPLIRGHCNRAESPHKKAGNPLAMRRLLFLLQIHHNA